jgi:hypothetical protein
MIWILLSDLWVDVLKLRLEGEVSYLPDYVALNSKNPLP